jgi:RNA polymerase sigma factor (TIGR02999 family)
MTQMPGDVTLLLLGLRRGDQEAERQLAEVVYRELHQMAARYMRRERPDHTLQATALVNEAYVRLIDQRGKDWQNRAHFFGVAAQIMRRVLVDHARTHNAAKRGGEFQKISLDDDILPFSHEKSDELVALDEALRRLAVFDPRQSRVVELRFFGGLTEDETAEVLGISSRTVKREWSVAKVWLHSEMNK